MILAGDLAPDFALLSQTGESIALSETLMNAPNGLILLFFASSFLPGDRRGLQAYQRAYAELQAQGIGLLALSGINWESIHTLAKKDGITFPLLFDACCRRAKRYGVMWVPKFVNGRATFYISHEGNILKAGKGLISPESLLRL